MSVAEAEQITDQAQDVWPGFDDETMAQLKQSGEPALLIQQREEAYQEFVHIPSPTDQDEEWRRTDPARFPVSSLTRLPNLVETQDLPPSPWDEYFDVVVAVTENSFVIQDRTGEAKAKGVTVRTFADAARTCPDLLEKYFKGRALPAKSGKYEAFTSAFWNFGLFVHVPEGVELEKGILVRYRINAPDGMLIPRLIAVVERQGKAVITERLESPDDARFMAVPGRELYVGEAANLKLVSLQEWGMDSYQVSNDWGLVERDANLNWITLNLGSRVSKMKFGSDVSGPGSAADMDGVFFAAGEQHLDQRTLQIHSSPDTYSRLLYKGAVKDTAYSVYQGLIVAKPGAIRVDAYQTNNNLVLNDGARADSLPGLLIDADDLQCSHGCTISNLDPDHLFYLHSRGIGDMEARRLLILGFFMDVVDRIPHPFIREIVQQHIDEKTGI